MGHSLFGLIGRAEVIADARARVALERVTLAQGFTLLPLTGAVREAIGGAPFPFPALPYLSDGLARWTAELSRRGAVAVVWTEYCGGAGGQAAAVWQGGALVLGPLVDSSGPTRTWPINRALVSIGVVPEVPKDAFDSLGVGRFRRTEEAADES